MAYSPREALEDDAMPIFYDEGTLKKVYDALKVAGIEGQQAIDAVFQMQNLGILFRERWNQDNRNTSV
jgi:hypothetical protein